MRPNHLFTTIFLYTITAAFLLLATAGCVPAKPELQANLAPDAREVLLEDDEVRENVDQGTSTAVESDLTQVAPQQNGKSILERYCAQCHLSQSLEQMRKPRSEWEGILRQMDRLGVKLSDDERTALLDYLAVYDK